VNEKLTYKIAKEYLRGLKLAGSLEQLGFDVTCYHPNLCDTLFELLGISVVADEVLDIIEKYEDKIIKISYFEFIDGGLNKLTVEMMDKLLAFKNQTNL